MPPLENPQVSRSELKLPEESFVISTLCRLVHRKRLDLLIDAAAQLDHRNVHVVIMGSGPCEEELQAQAGRLGVAGRVHLVGRVDDRQKAAYLACSDVFCLPSEHEGFGLVYLEAMSLETPVITTNVGGQNDIIRDGVDGYLIDVGQVEPLVERLRELINNPDQRRQMAVDAASRAMDFTPFRCAEEFFESFAACDGGQAGGGNAVSSGRKAMQDPVRGADQKSANADSAHNGASRNALAAVRAGVGWHLVYLDGDQWCCLVSQSLFL